MNTPELAWIATGREHSLFLADYLACHKLLAEAINKRRLLVIGGAGSIGSATARLLLHFNPAVLHIVDLDENGLAELVRDLRCSRLVAAQTELRLLPLDYGSPIMHRFLASQKPYDHIMNFAAVKHVRSEKDVCSVLHMFDTNVLKMHRFLGWASESHQTLNVFSVSTDKAANPVNLMGASKRLMEHVMFSSLPYHSTPAKITSARFANVAFSNGSLLANWQIRMQKRQPLACPSGTQRFFISCEEAAQLCLMASAIGAAASLLAPANESIGLTLMEKVLQTFLRSHSLLPCYCQDELEATQRVAEALSQNQYPVLLTNLDTQGEKPYEEFLGRGEKTRAPRWKAIQEIIYCSGNTPLPAELGKTLQELEALTVDPTPNIATMRNIVKLVSRAVPGFSHQHSDKVLDDRI